MKAISHFFELFVPGFVCFFFLAPVAIAGTGSGHYVGNGGEVFRIDGEFYSRDLYEAGVHLNPYVGTDIDTSIASRVQQSVVIRSLTNLGIDRELLLQKLSDLNALWPNLGHFAFSAIEFYQWNKVSAVLGKLSDSTPILDIPEEDRLVVANRFLYTIRLANSPTLPIWDRLSREHKVAIVLHEALYSLTRPVCPQINPAHCEQNPVFSREVVGAVFSNIRVNQGRLP